MYRAPKKIVMTAVSLCIMSVSVCTGCSAFNGSIKLTGQVVDAQGEAIDDVRVSVRKSSFTWRTSSFKSVDESSLELKDGSFRISCRTCTGIGLHFSKSGYYSETLDFGVKRESVPSDTEPASTAMNDRYGLKVESLEQLGLRIVLRSNENQARLDRYEGYLETSETGPLRVVPLRRDLGSSGVKIDRLSIPPSKSAKMLAGYVQLLVTITEDGQLAAKPMPDMPGAQFREPAATALDFSEANGGVLLYEYSDESPAAVYRAMATAPKDGYQPTLDVGSDDRSGYYYFYCRIGQLYCKGRTIMPSFRSADGQQVMGSYVEIRVNPDGSRNLETSR